MSNPFSLLRRRKRRNCDPLDKQRAGRKTDCPAFIEVVGGLWDDQSEVRPYLLPIQSVAAVGRLRDGKTIIHLNSVVVDGDPSSIWAIDRYDDLRKALEGYFIEAEPSE